MKVDIDHLNRVWEDAKALVRKSNPKYKDGRKLSGIAKIDFYKAVTKQTKKMLGLKESVFGRYGDLMNDSVCLVDAG